MEQDEKAKGQRRGTEKRFEERKTHPGLPFGVNLGTYFLSATSHGILAGEERAASVHAASHSSTNTLYLALSTDLKGLPCISSSVGLFFSCTQTAGNPYEASSGSKITTRFICEETRKTYFKNLLVP